MFITSFGEQNITYRSCSNLRIHITSIALAFVLTGCNTVKGVGKDVSKAGDAVSKTAEKTSQEIRNN